MTTRITAGMLQVITSKLFKIEEQIQRSEGYPFNLYQLNVALENAVEGKFGGIRPRPVLSVAAIFILGPVAVRMTKECFPEPDFEWYPRSGIFTEELPLVQPETGPCAVTALKYSHSATLRELALLVLGKPPNTSNRVINSLLLERGHIMTLPQVMEMARRTNCGGKTGMRTTVSGNLFFMRRRSEEFSITVGSIRRISKRVWRPGIYEVLYFLQGRFSNGNGRINIGPRLLVPNFDASKLKT